MDVMGVVVTPLHRTYKFIKGGASGYHVVSQAPPFS